MSASETISAQITCDQKGCTNTVIIRDGGIQKARRTARDSYDWAVIQGRDICVDHKRAALRALSPVGVN